MCLWSLEQNSGWRPAEHNGICDVIMVVGRRDINDYFSHRITINNISYYLQPYMQYCNIMNYYTFL